MNRPSWLILVGVVLVAGGPAAAQPVFFPLEVGNRWTYVVVEHDFFSDEREVSVDSVEAGRFVVQTRTSGSSAVSVVRLQAEGQDVLIDTPDEGLVPYYRFGEDEWIHRDPFECDDGATVRIESRDDTVETPAGVFTDCLRLVFQGRCADAGILTQWWAPEVGLVKSIEDNFAGAVTWVLRKSLLREPFRRGDANADGAVDVADMVYLILHLFSGGPGARCNDVSDVNDDGRINIADPVFGLDYLFGGSAAPPAPGPLVPGYDGTPTDPFTCGDPPVAALPGVRIEFTGVPETVTLEEAAAGVGFRYEIVIENDLRGVLSKPLDAGRCDQPHESGLRILETISGRDQLYCLCDRGLCLPTEDVVMLRAGRYEGIFEWSGRNWRGPSDTGNPMGDPFPPGRYTLEVRAEGLYRMEEDCAECPAPFELHGTVEFDLVP